MELFKIKRSFSVAELIKNLARRIAVIKPTGTVGCVCTGPFQNNIHHRTHPGPTQTASLCITCLRDLWHWQELMLPAQKRTTLQPTGLRKRLPVTRSSQLHRVSWRVMLPLPMGHYLLCDIMEMIIHEKGPYFDLPESQTSVNSVSLMCVPTATVNWRVIPDQHSGACKRIKCLYLFQTEAISLQSITANNINISLISFNKIGLFCLFKQCFLVDLTRLFNNEMTCLAHLV